MESRLTTLAFLRLLKSNATTVSLSEQITLYVNSALPRTGFSLAATRERSEIEKD